MLFTKAAPKRVELGGGILYSPPCQFLLPTSVLLPMSVKKSCQVFSSLPTAASLAAVFGALLESPFFPRRPAGHSSKNRVSPLPMQ